MRRALVLAVLIVATLAMFAVQSFAGPGGGGVDPCHPPFTGMMLC